jgi:hypothetical protein
MDRQDFNDFAEQVRHRLGEVMDTMCADSDDGASAYSAAASGALASAANTLAAIAKAQGFDAAELEDMRETFVRQFHSHLDQALAAETLN